MRWNGMSPDVEETDTGQNSSRSRRTLQNPADTHWVQNRSRGATQPTRGRQTMICLLTAKWHIVGSASINLSVIGAGIRESGCATKHTT